MPPHPLDKDRFGKVFADSAYYALHVILSDPPWMIPTNFVLWQSVILCIVVYSLLNLTNHTNQFRFVSLNRKAMVQ